MTHSHLVLKRNFFVVSWSLQVLYIKKTSAILSFTQFIPGGFMMNLISFRSKSLLICSILCGFQSIGMAQEQQLWQADGAPVVGVYTSGTSANKITDDGADGKACLLTTMGGVGDFIEFALPNVLPGGANLQLRYKVLSESATCVVSVGSADGSEQVPVGKPLEMLQGDAWSNADVGICNIPVHGTRTIRLTVTAATSKAANISFDRITLIQNNARHMAEPKDFQATTIGSGHCVVRWQAQGSCDGYLVRQRGGLISDWRVVAVAPGNALECTVPGFCDAADYELQVCAFTAEARSAWSQTLKLRTLESDHTMRGRLIATTNGRIGEASMILRRDGSILMYANSQQRITDQGLFEIHEMSSADHGLTWSKPKPFLAAADRSFLMPALLRLDNGSIIFSYTERDIHLTWAKRWCQTSLDDGVTWSKPVLIAGELPFVNQGLTFTVPTGPHDRLIQTSNGRVIFPLHFPRYTINKENPAKSHGTEIASAVYYSDDRGATWHRAERTFFMRGTIGRDLKCLLEPSIVEIALKQLLMYMRSNTGWYYESRSMDDGTTWTPPAQSSVRAPLTPAKLVKLPVGGIGIIFNGIIDESHMNLSQRWDLSTMHSTDGGKTWNNYRSIEFANPNDKKVSLIYCYPSMLFDGKFLHMTYFGPNGRRTFNLAYRRLPSDWFLSQPPSHPVSAPRPGPNQPGPPQKQFPSS